LLCFAIAKVAIADAGIEILLGVVQIEKDENIVWLKQFGGDGGVFEIVIRNLIAIAVVFVQPIGELLIAIALRVRAGIPDPWHA
jgi:hypothetical protein